MTVRLLPPSGTPARIALLACLLAAAACGRAGGARPGEPGQADREAIGALADAFLAAHNEGDAEALAALFTADAVVMPDDGATVEGRDAIADYFDDLLREAPATAEFTVREIRVSGDWAFESIDVNLLETDQDTGEDLETWARYVWILERQPGGGWKIARFIDNIEPTGEEDADVSGEGRET